MERRGGTRQGNPVAETQNLTTQQREPQDCHLHQWTPTKPFSTGEGQDPMSETPLRRQQNRATSQGEEAQTQRATRLRCRHTATEARRRRPNRRTKWLKRQRTIRKRKLEQGRKHRSIRLRQGDDRTQRNTESKRKKRANTPESGRDKPWRTPFRFKKTNNTGDPPPLYSAHKTKPEHPKRITQTKVNQSERQPQISGTKDGEKTRE